ncbi:MAG TPA: acyl-CoA thioester hydrolase/BAAT C-terminal domain-containing protein [Candidatus Solibacter sp.]|jgi:dienelactone hydrolase|nr:acyl-CoA thioester hydrolase/BAAT C-terminal domain-containing protein [Candidatus Solibacter sp.]
MAFDLEVTSSGQRLARLGLSRPFGGGSYSTSSESLSTEGFVGRYYSPPPGPPRTAVLLIGGSDGGMPGPLLAGHLASDGYPTLALTYFSEPGLPQTLSSIPLEYFATALRWLATQPGVDAKRMVVMGVSRGSEAAMLLAANYTDLVDGVVASVPSNVALCAFPGCGGAAWTLHGAPVPYTVQFNNPAPTDDPSAVIPVERMRGALLLDCGGEDLVWDSCPYAHAIIDRLNRHAYPFPHQLQEYPHAGHGVGGLVPYEPGLDLGAPAKLAGTASDSNELARQLLWPKVLAFLAAE